MSKIHFIDYICRPYCMFFREGEKEEMACLGARVAEKLSAESLFDPKAIGFAKDPSAWRNKTHDAILLESVCSKCEFMAEDCEYRSDQPPADTEPCGGLILLALLISCAVIDKAILENCS